MDRRNDQNLPEHRAPGSPGPSRNLTTQELEAVIRRAVELQSGSSARAEDGVSEGEVVRIGQELGLDAATVRRAVAEVRMRSGQEGGSAVARAMGDATARATRVLRRPAASTGLLLERYLREAEVMVPQRRFPDRTRYIRDPSLVAGLTRLARSFSRPQQPLNLKQLDVAVSALDADSCLLELSVDLSGSRAGFVGGALGGGGGVATALATVFWATAIPDPFMLVGVPIVAGAWYGMRAIYASVFRSTQDKLESLLDRVEHNELR